jgi:hypothetical protein
MKIRKSLFLLPLGLIFFSCTNGVERPAARIRFNILPERVNVGQYDFPESMYRELAELVYIDSIMLPALRDAEIAVNAQSAKIFRDSILVTKTPGSYGNSEHDLVVWQADEEKAFRLVTALYDRLVEYYKRNKTGSAGNTEEVVDGSVDETSTITDLNNQLADVERRMERWRNNADSMLFLEQEKQNILDQFSTAVQEQASTTDVSSEYDEGDGTPYVKYYAAERLGLIQMPQKRKPN